MIFTNLERLIVDDYSINVENALSYFCAHKSKILNDPVGKYPVNDKFFYMIQEYETCPEKDIRWESHRKYIDIQMILEGEEIIETADINTLSIKESYNEQKDMIFYTGDYRTKLILKKFDFVILFPEDAHRPGLSLSNSSSKVRKCLFKVSAMD